MKTIAKKRETRTVDIKNVQTRADDNEPLKVSGYAAIFNSQTSIGDFFDEIIEPGAFKRTISENDDIRALFNHDWNVVLGRTKSGTLKLSEDKRGLKFDLELPNTTAGKDLAASMERGDINQCSFGFVATEETWDYTAEPALRTIHEVELYEVSIVSIPAYDDTEAALVRSKEIDKFVEKRIQLLNKINKTLEEKK